MGAAFHRARFLPLKFARESNMAAADMITHEGQYSLWIGFAGMFLPFLWFFMEMTKKEEGKKKFHIYTMMVNGIAAIAYLIMASGYGWEVVADRQFFYVRYIDWFFTTPLLLLDLCALGRASEDTTNFLIGMDLLMIVSGVIGASLTGVAAKDDYKPWTFFVLGFLFFLPIVYNLGVSMPAKITGASAKATFGVVSMLTVVTWFLYPVVWILAEGTHYVTPNVEVILYTVMDLLSKSVFGIILISSHAAMEEAMFVAAPEETAPLMSAAKDVEAPPPAPDKQKGTCCG